MSDHELSKDAADRLLDGAVEHDELPAEYRPVAAALEDLRVLRTAALDAAVQTETVQAMAEAVRRAVAASVGAATIARRRREPSATSRGMCAG